MKKQTKRIIMTAMLATGLIFISAWNAAAGIGSRIRTGGLSDGDFQVNFEPVKTVFKTGESIRFKVKGSKTFYLYLFSIDSLQNRGYVLLPNLKQQ